MILKSKCKRLHGFTVDWTKELPMITPGEADYDNATHVRRDFDTFEQAKAYAQEVAPLDCFGSVAIDEFQMHALHNHPQILEREYVGETIYIDKE